MRSDEIVSMTGEDEQTVTMRLRTIGHPPERVAEILAARKKAAAAEKRKATMAKKKAKDEDE